MFVVAHEQPHGQPHGHSLRRGGNSQVAGVADTRTGVYSENMTTTRKTFAATMTAANGMVTLTASNGESFSVTDGATLVARMDRKLTSAGYIRSGYTSTAAGAMTTTLTFIV